MATPTRFERQEVKYMVTEQQQAALLRLMQDYMQPDRFGRSTICNLYFDTPDFLLIRRSTEKPVYKEKLRLRSYGVATADSRVYAELKKKYKGIVYKRREDMAYHYAEGWLLEGETPVPTGQVVEEIQYLRRFYRDLAARVYISAEREAYLATGGGCPDLRITFDRNILWRAHDLRLSSGVYGNSLLAPGQRLMEVKSSLGLPLWLCRFLSEQGIYKTSFSKYGHAYRSLCKQQNQGGQISA